MSSPREDMATEAANVARVTSQRAYNIALPALSTEFGALNQAIAQGGEPGYLQSAYAGARGAAREGMAEQGITSLQASQTAKKGALGAGNVGAISPQLLGGEMARALYGTRVQEAAGQLEQMNKLFGFGIGQSQRVGSAALGATETELANIQMMRPYNMGYAGVLGGLNMAGTLYGALGQPGSNPYASINAGQGWNVGGLSGIGGT